MRAAGRVVLAASITTALVAGGAVAWPYLEPYASDAAQTVQAYGSELSELVAADQDSAAGDDGGQSAPVQEAAPIEEQDHALLDDLRGPLSGPSSPPDLSGEVGAEGWEASFALSELDALLGSATVSLDGLREPSANARALTQSLTAGRATDDIVAGATNRVVVRLAAAVDHAADVLGPTVVASLLTELRATPLGAPAPGLIVLRQIDGYFQSAWMVLFSGPTLDAVLTLNSDTFASFGVDGDGRLRPVVDLTYEHGSGFRVPVDGSGVEATVWHELGHAMTALAQRLNQGQTPGHWTASEASIQSHLISVIGAQAWESRTATVSGYAGENVNEFVAECFAEYLGSSSPRPVARAVVAEFRRAIQQAPAENVAAWMGR